MKTAPAGLEMENISSMEGGVDESESWTVSRGTIRGFGAGRDTSRPGVIIRTFTLDGVLGRSALREAQHRGLIVTGSAEVLYRGQEYSKSIYLVLRMRDTNACYSINRRHLYHVRGF